ncbi:MAG TPA: DUF1501 domain-containing protein, partial [Planctomycetota bacterium]|nr:DUF1501 domain-containing protein [Planctomycetota bacterium]
MPRPNAPTSQPHGREELLELTRRTFLGRGSLSLGALAFATLEARRLGARPLDQGADHLAGAPNAFRGVVDPLHFRPRAKRVIFLCMAGGPSHLETFDPKPELER